MSGTMMIKYKITAILNIGVDPVSRLQLLDVDFKSIFPLIPSDVGFVKADAIKAANDLIETAIKILGNIRIQIHQPMVWTYLPNGALAEWFNPFENGGKYESFRG